MNKTQVKTLARATRDELLSRGYQRVTIKDITTQINCIIEAIREFGQCLDERRAYDPIHASDYYKHNGAAYCAAQTFIFEWAPVRVAHKAAAANRRALMIEAGTWSDAHERAYNVNFR